MQTSAVPFGRQAIAAGFAIRLGADPSKMQIPAHLESQRQNIREIGDAFSSYSFLDMVNEACQVDNRGVAYGHDEKIRAAVSTPTFTAAFSDAMNAKFEQGFSEYPDSTREWVRESDSLNFKPIERVRLEKGGGLDKLPRGGSAKHFSPSDTVETYKISRYAKQLVFDEMDMIDDNLHVLVSAADEMIAAAGRMRPDLVYSILLSNPSLADSVALFHADRGNALTQVLAAAGLKAAASAMGAQRENGVPLDIRPEFLLVPPDLDFTARELTTATTVVVAGNTDRDVPNKNSLADLRLRTVCEPRLGAPGVTDPSTGTTHAGSATNWFLAANARRAATIEVAYRAGTNRRPVVRQYELSQGQWGLGWDINFDIGAKALAAQGLFRGNV